MKATRLLEALDCLLHLQVGLSVDGAQHDDNSVGPGVVGDGGKAEGPGTRLTAAQHTLRHKQPLRIDLGSTVLEISSNWASSACMSRQGQGRVGEREKVLATDSRRPITPCNMEGHYVTHCQRSLLDMPHIANSVGNVFTRRHEGGAAGKSR